MTVTRRRVEAPKPAPEHVEPWDVLVPPGGSDEVFARLASAFSAVTDCDYETAYGLVDEAEQSLRGDGEGCHFCGRVILGHAYRIMKARRKRQKRIERRRRRADQKEDRKARKGKRNSRGQFRRKSRGRRLR